jgi:NTP pyrophosphatase (non-canonical NTP hydrolase)
MSKTKSFKELVEITKRVIREFEKCEQRSWGIEGSMMELTKQVGELARHIMVFEKYYLKVRESDPQYKTDKRRVADELADILFCLIRIADHYKIDLEKAHLRARRRELGYLRIK